MEESNYFDVSNLLEDIVPDRPDAWKEPSPEPSAPDSEPQESVLAGIFDWLDSIVMSVIAVVLIFTFLFRLVGIVGSSMNNTLEENDRVFIYNLFYTPKAGDIVVISRNSSNDSALQESGKEPIIKRVIAVAGDTVDIRFEDGIGYVYVNGVLQDEPYIREPISEYKPILEAIRFPAFVPDGCIFVMGDNRNASLDSRSALIGDCGMIDTRYVLGRAVLRIYPFHKIGWL